MNTYFKPTLAEALHIFINGKISSKSLAFTKALNVLVIELEPITKDIISDLQLNIKPKEMTKLLLKILSIKRLQPYQKIYHVEAHLRTMLYEIAFWIRNVEAE